VIITWHSSHEVRPVSASPYHSLDISDNIFENSSIFLDMLMDVLCFINQTT